MQLRTIALVLAGAVAAVWAPAPAAACDPASFDTAYDLADRATTVALIDVGTAAAGKARVTRVEVWKGALPATVELDVDLTSTCSTGMRAGDQGIVYLDGARQMLGAYDGFTRDATVIAALRTYVTGTTAAVRAGALVDVAVSRDWSRSYQAAHALANRLDLALALDAAARDRVIKRLAKVGEQHPLILVAARLHDARTARLQRRRRFDSATQLRDVLGGALDAESDTAVLADLIAARSTSRMRRIAALERCEQVHGFSLLRFTDYARPDADDDAAAWQTRADACRTGTRIP